MAHIPSPTITKLYKNHNERLYWLHNTIIKHLLDEFKSNFESLERMYRLLKNAGNKDNSETKKLGFAAKNNWAYSEVHTGIARACLELKLAINKSNTLDMLLDACAMNNHDIELDILSKDIDDLIDNITKCLTTVQSSQIRLKKLKGKMAESVPTGDEVIEESAPILKIEDIEPETKDEVFYFVKTEEDEIPVRLSDDVTAPGKKERENTKIVLSELKRKLGKREDMMRERERQALVKTMPELKNIPEFPRQIEFDDFVVKKGYIHKMKPKADKKTLFSHYKIKSRTKNNKAKKYKLKLDKYESESDIKDDKYEANALLNVKSKIITAAVNKNNLYITKWCKSIPYASFAECKTPDFESTSFSGSISDVAINKNVTQAVNTQQITLKVTKKDLELATSSSESDFEFYSNQRMLLNDIRRHRVARKKNHPIQKRKPPMEEPRDNVDESLKPIEYSFGAGLAMASVLQGSNAKFLNLAQEEVFNGDGEVSNDSGNDEDA